MPDILSYSDLATVSLAYLILFYPLLWEVPGLDPVQVRAGISGL
jgi:hypothetical protein